MKSFNEFTGHTILDEATEFLSQDVIDAIEGLTAHQQFTDAALLLAKALGETKYTKVLKHVLDIQKILGEIPHDLKSFRYNIRNQLLRLSRARYHNHGAVSNSLMEDANAEEAPCASGNSTIPRNY